MVVIHNQHYLSHCFTWIHPMTHTCSRKSVSEYTSVAAIADTVPGMIQIPAMSLALLTYYSNRQHSHNSPLLFQASICQLQAEAALLTTCSQIGIYRHHIKSVDDKRPPGPQGRHAP